VSDNIRCLNDAVSLVKIVVLTTFHVWVLLQCHFFILILQGPKFFESDITSFIEFNNANVILYILNVVCKKVYFNVLNSVLSHTLVYCFNKIVVPVDVHTLRLSQSYWVRNRIWRAVKHCPEFNYRVIFYRASYHWAYLFHYPRLFTKLINIFRIINEHYKVKLSILGFTAHSEVNSIFLGR